MVETKATKLNIEFNGKRPIWIVCRLFEGHQGHWADCFCSNATIDTIEYMLKYDSIMKDENHVITEMTDEQIAQYPDIIPFCEWLMEEYGTI